MANADLTRLMNNARVHVPGALDNIIQLELFNVLNEFFQETDCWREDISFATVANVTSYDIESEDNATLNRLMAIVNSAGIPVYGSMSEPGTVDLRYAPTTVDTLTATVALTVTDPVPRDGFPVCPDWVVNKYGNELTDGVIGRLMTQPAKPYTNATLAVYHLKRFRAGIVKAYSEAKRSNTYRGQNWVFPQGFVTRRR